jgi:MFS transporter, AAHS family, 4-hydroxybenzoate transporter
VLSASGIPLATALRASVWFNSGGIVGAITGAVLIGAYGSRRVGTTVALAGCTAAVLLGVMTWSSGDVARALMFPLVVLAGASLNGMQAFLYTVSAHSYPTYIRGTGMGVAAAVSRLGGVLSSAVGSAYFAAGLRVAYFFYILAAVILVTAMSFFSLRSHVPPRTQVRGVVPANLGDLR